MRRPRFEFPILIKRFSGRNVFALQTFRRRNAFDIGNVAY